MLTNNASKQMPKFFAKIPFWIWPILGLICLALAVPGYLAQQDKKIRQAALAAPIPEVIDLQDFDQASNVSPVGEINIFAQSSADYSFVLDETGGTDRAHMIPLFSAYEAPSHKRVDYVLLAPQSGRFEQWLEDNTIGTARMGDLFEINGAVTDGQGYVAAIRVALRDAGLEQSDDMLIFAPFVEGRATALAATQYKSYGNPFILAGAGLWMIWFGFVVWSRMKKLKTEVRRRMGELETRATDEEGQNLSRLKRRSEKLATAADETKAALQSVEDVAKETAKPKAKAKSRSKKKSAGSKAGPSGAGVAGITPAE